MRPTPLPSVLLALLFLGLFGISAALGDETSSEEDPPASSSSATGLFPAELGPLRLEAIPAPLASLSAQSCNACHGEIHDQWADSGHAQSATSSVYRAAAAALGNPPLCQECHLPLEVQRAWIPAGPGGTTSGQVENPGYEPSLVGEGVTCAACHVREGGIVGPRELPAGQAPHPVLGDPSMASAEACSYCHQAELPGGEEHPFIDTVGEWQRSSFGEAGITCQQCHMPRISGVIAGSRYAAYSSHRWMGDHAPRDIARALTLQVRLRSSRIQRGETLRSTAELMNTGAGHSVPTGLPSHRIELHFAVEDPEGEVPRGAEAMSEWFGRTVEAEAPFKTISDDRLESGGRRSVDYAYTADKKSPTGEYSLKVTVVWWATTPEQVEALGLDPADARVVVTEQRIPFVVD